MAHSLGPFPLHTAQFCILCLRTHAVEDHHGCYLRPSELPSGVSFGDQHHPQNCPANGWLMLVRLHTIHGGHTVATITVTTRWPYDYVSQSPGNPSGVPKRSTLEGGPSGTPQSQEESHLDNAIKLWDAVCWTLAGLPRI